MRNAARLGLKLRPVTQPRNDAKYRLNEECSPIGFETGVDELDPHAVDVVSMRNAARLGLKLSSSRRHKLSSIGLNEECSPIGFETWVLGDAGTSMTSLNEECSPIGFETTNPGQLQPPQSLSK